MNWTAARKMPWGVLVLFGGGLSLARAMDQTGLAAWIGDRAAVVRNQHLDQAKVHEFDVAGRRDLDIAGLDVSMDNPGPVSMIERGGNLPDERDDLFRFSR